MPINCHKIKNYNINDPRYNFHIEDSTKYNKNIYPLHLMKENDRISVYNTIDDTIKWTPDIFTPKNQQLHSFYDQANIKKDKIEHFASPLSMFSIIPKLDSSSTLSCLCLLLLSCYLCFIKR